MGWFKALLGVDKAVEVAGDTIKSGMSILDEAFDTDQEKAERMGQLYDQWLKQQELIGQQSSPTSLSRRYIAWAVVWIVIVELIICTALVLLQTANYLKQVTEITNLVGTFQIGWAFVAVIVFYFGTHMLAKLK